MSSSAVILNTETIKVSTDSAIAVTNETQAEIPYQTDVINHLEVTNALLGDILGALIFIIIILTMIILYKLIHHNVTNNI